MDINIINQLNQYGVCVILFELCFWTIIKLKLMVI